MAQHPPFEIILLRLPPLRSFLMAPKTDLQQNVVAEQIDPIELNAWKRGITPQAEIWNGRLAMLGLSIGMATLLIVRMFNNAA
ncbi:possible high light inducible protein-related protein [Synechococcus sp. CC9311]|nr:possible high light inducible protein-related protein [Synechococcus sp. CC9311]